ncbi:hypothetical protein HanPI659440_Chr16g0641371 [Helianthus annuus]|nr:hypothetical protein HanPI659440_Chr16g0641371 [Helianthus annuus]
MMMIIDTDLETRTGGRLQGPADLAIIQRVRLMVPVFGSGAVRFFSDFGSGSRVRLWISVWFRFRPNPVNTNVLTGQTKSRLVKLS